MVDGLNHVAIISPAWLYEGPLRGVMQALIDAGYQAFVVGGCVRDAVMNRNCDDIDIATNATPEQVKAAFDAQPGYKMIPTGVEHGTWTVRAGKSTFEITTYRLDVATDGRRATVEYAERMIDDANRRDFTMNALYADIEGKVYDPTKQGFDDCENRYLRFVGVAEDRCKEDYLRILRLFRFLATIADDVDHDARKAAAQHVDGLKGVSGERIWTETKKMLSSPAQGRLYRSLSMMLSHGVTPYVFPQFNMGQMNDVLMLEKQRGFQLDWRNRYAAMCGKKIMHPASRSDTAFIEKMGHLYDNPPEHGWPALVHAEGTEVATQFAMRLDRPLKPEDVREWREAKPPYTSEDFFKKGYEGPELGKVMRAAKDYWYSKDLKSKKPATMKAAMKAVPLPA